MGDRRRIAVLTTGRQDYGILRSTLMLLRDDQRFDLRLWVGGMHLKERFGRTIGHVKSDGFTVSEHLDFIGEPPEPLEDAGRALATVGQALVKHRPDVLVLVADRAETLAAGFAATMSRVPLVHLHGGEETQGALDNACRHALTKLSHLHLVSHGAHARRVIQMGENPADVVVVGAPGLDNMYRSDLPNRAELARDLGCDLLPPVVLVTVHSTTLANDPTADVYEVAAAMERVNATYVVTQPNADQGGTVIRSFWEEWATGRRRVKVLDALGERRYWALLREVSAVLGNSSSGIIEAPTAGIPVINVGDRQQGRLRHSAVRDVPAVSEHIVTALRWALSPDTKAEITARPSLYPAGPAAPRIVSALASWQIPSPPRKIFWDIV